MIKVTYTAWDGRQLLDGDALQLFSAFADELGHSGNVAEAMRALLQSGAKLAGGERTAGLEDLVRRVREALKECYSRLDLASAFAELWRKVAMIQELEDRAVSAGRGGIERPGRSRGMGSLSDEIMRLRRRRLEDELSRRLFDELFLELERIRRLERLGKEAVPHAPGRSRTSYRQAAELLERIEELKELERRLIAANLSGIDGAVVSRLLGAEAGGELESILAMVQQLESSGYLIGREGRFVLSPKGARTIGDLALRDIYQGMARDKAGEHATGREGAGEIRFERSKPFSYGEPLHINVAGTLRKALSGGRGLPLKVRPQDFQVFDTDHTSSAATVLLLDMSWSMSWDGRFAAAKKVALALESLIRTQFPRDFFAIVGFFTRAVELKIAELPEASWNVGDPFTNLQDGLRLAARLLLDQRLSNRHIILVTDGQPTAYFAGGRLYCEWPLSFGGIGMRAAQAALQEVRRVTRQGIKINTFMLDDSPNLKLFVDSIARLNRGRALYTRPDRLGQYVLVDYVSRRRKRI